MTPIKQTIISNPEGTVRGNCFQACLASLLNLSLEEVPDTRSMRDGSWFPPVWYLLIKHGYTYQGTCSKPEELEKYKGLDGYCIAYGKSHRPWVNLGHCCIYHNGQMVHDPHPDNNGLLTVEGFYMIERDNE
jgi:hypothetical protein